MYNDSNYLDIIYKKLRTVLAYLVCNENNLMVYKAVVVYLIELIHDQLITKHDQKWLLLELNIWTAEKLKDHNEEDVK